MWVTYARAPSGEIQSQWALGASSAIASYDGPRLRVDDDDAVAPVDELDAGIDEIGGGIELDVVRPQIGADVDHVDDLAAVGIDDAQLVCLGLALTVGAGAIRVAEIGQPAARIPRQLVRLGDEILDRGKPLERLDIEEVQLARELTDGDHEGRGSAGARGRHEIARLLAGSARPTRN